MLAIFVGEILGRDFSSPSEGRLSVYREVLVVTQLGWEGGEGGVVYTHVGWVNEGEVDDLSLLPQCCAQLPMAVHTLSPLRFT